MKVCIMVYNKYGAIHITTLYEMYPSTKKVTFGFQDNTTLIIDVIFTPK